ncbi:coiled-coil domain-containing protein 39 [Contarinia nasturtii]|uniref:coiled-coil domain-containing protein 39 n=1 Tax=Contarinia nasturtii TaxID=265458 RepID=UPI0012D49BF3|nr:coiled-coil domain-containing protein 39 [Contarinia nasturtii]
MNQHISAVMETIGWPEDAFMPIANDENRRLMENIEQYMEAKKMKTQHRNQLTERVNMLKDHFQNAQNGVIQNLKLLDANRSQCDNEYHMLKLAENELATSEHLKGDVKKEVISLDEKNHTIEKDMTRLNEKIDNLGTDMQWMKNALIEWAQAIDHDDQTNTLIDKYCKEDKRKAEAYEVQRQAVQKTIVKNKSRLIELESEKQSLEQIVERTNDLYRQAILERRQMTHTWSTAVQTLNARNNSIKETFEKIAQVKDIGERKTIEMKEQTEFLDQQIQNNKESEFMIAELNGQISKVRGLLTRYNEEIQLKSNDLITLRRQMQHDTNCLQQMRQKNQKAAIEYDAKTKQIAKLKEIVDDLTSKVGKIQNEKNNAEDRLRHLDELFEDEEKCIHAIEMEMARLSQMVYRSSQIIQQQYNEQKLIETEIHTLESSIKAISGNFLNQEKELARQMEMQYDIHFKTLKMECRVAKMQGQLKELDPELIERSETLQLLCAHTQKKRDKVKRELCSAEETERRLRSLLFENQSNHVELMNKLRNRQSECEASQRSIATNRDILHERLVEHSLIKMRVHQMAEMYNKQMEKFYDLEQHKLQLQLAVDERLVDLRCQMDLLATKRKHLRGERDQLRADINERRLKIDALKARFELTNELLGKNEDGTVVSAIQLKMETAQEKALLLEQGSKLNEKVLNAEADIKALENTLILLNFSNDKYKRKMGQVQDNDELNEKMQKLSNEYATAMNRLKVARNDFDNETRKLDELQRQYEHFEIELDEISRNRLENNDALIKLHREIMEQNSKVERAKRELKIAKKAMMRKVGDREYVRLLEKDLTTKELESRNTTVLHQLSDIVDTVPGMSLVITKLLYEKGLEIPIHHQNARNAASSLSRAISRTSMRSSGRASECSLTINSREDDGIISRLSERSFATTSSTVSSKASTTTRSTKKSDKSAAPTTASLSFQIEGQSIRSDKVSK